jgi:type I restriction enzyme S subunit
MIAQTVKISEIAEQVRGVTYSKDDASPSESDGMVPILRANNITDNGLQFSNLVWVPKSCVSQKQMLRKGDIVVATSSGSLDVVGKAAPVEHDVEASFGAFCKVVRPGKSTDSHYLANYFKTAKYRAIISGLAAGANINNLRNEHIDNLEIPLPALAEQKRIAAILDKADAIRRNLQQSLRLSDDFLRSVFLDMFGDPVTNPNGWPEEPMSELMSDSKIGLVRASDQFGWDMPVPYVRMDALTSDGAFIPEKVQGTNATPAEIASYSLKPGDLLFNTRNSKELVGKVAIYPGPEGATFNNNLMRIRFRKGIDPYVIWAQFQFPRVQRELEARKQGTTSVFAVYGKNLATLPFHVPPSDLQRDYRKVVDKVSAARQKTQSFLAQSETLFSSLQQRAFRGDL